MTNKWAKIKEDKQKEKNSLEEKIKKAQENPALSPTFKPPGVQKKSEAEIEKEKEEAEKAQRCPKCGRGGHSIAACLYPPK